ncbi:cytochrome c oxidase subunit IV [Streptomyces sp. SLBN-118]|uniref:cytochrome c oxidase subunit 4 n=1 Tax=Streptomyces sp. SLBN-118 TaxID=2768454 RepID=UPI00114E4897|nr:cytochrome c oxidase subunit 4 [Streptomyces sp. SLBN-118]TQK42676.1 cytochrome c oxidase subunit IV [Streptomyces sp. SLBN-118]
MKTEAILFAGVAAFFLVTDVLYAAWSKDPAGTAALTVAFLMALLVSFVFATNYRRKGLRPEDRNEGEVHERAGPVDFFPPHSAWPVLIATGVAVGALGTVFGLWLFLIGLGVVLAGVCGMVFQFSRPPL